jgi:hypothetical protein
MRQTRPTDADRPTPPGEPNPPVPSGIEGAMPSGARRPTVRALALVLLLGVVWPGVGGALELDVDAWDDFLTRYTSETSDLAGVRVDYAGLVRNPAWRPFVASLAAARPPEDRAGQLAFWVNVYNVLAADMVVRHLPLASIRDVGSLLRPVWKRPAGTVGGRVVTLDEVEHGILRPLGDPRIHAAIVCASSSCPALRREAYRAERVDAQLDDAVRRFLAHPDKGLRVEAGQVRLSRIFDWFAADFATAGGPLAFARPYLGDPVRSALDRLGPAPRIAWFDYDWSLNGVEEAAGR